MRFRFGTDDDASKASAALDEILGIKKRPSRVPENKAGIKRSMDLVRYEARVTSVTIPAAIARLQRADSWSLKQWRMAHRIIFEPVYEWAGQIRTVNIKKEDTFADKGKIRYVVDEALTRFCRKHRSGMNFVGELALLTPSECAREFAGLYHELNMAHPFMEGNGRSLKTFLTAMARQGGWDFKWSRIGDKKWEFDNACKAAAKKNLDPLIALFEQVIEPFDQSGALTISSTKKEVVAIRSELGLEDSKRPLRGPMRIKTSSLDR